MFVCFVLFSIQDSNDQEQPPLDEAAPDEKKQIKTAKPKKSKPSTTISNTNDVHVENTSEEEIVGSALIKKKKPKKSRFLQVHHLNCLVLVFLSNLQILNHVLTLDINQSIHNAKLNEQLQVLDEITSAQESKNEQSLKETEEELQKIQEKKKLKEQKKQRKLELKVCRCWSCFDWI